MIKLAIPVLENKNTDSPISEHFGHAPFFAFIELDGDKYQCVIEKNPFAEHSPGEIPGYMNDKNVNVMVVRGIGSRAVEFFNSYGITVYKGVLGSVSEIMNEYINKTLKDSDYTCNHSDHHH